jgi:hypothetical protein
MFRSFAITLTAIALTGCASIQTQALREASSADAAAITVFRVHAFNAGGVALGVGVNGTTFASLANDEYVTAKLPSGQQTVFVKASHGSPSSVSVALKPGDHLCFKTEADAANLGKVAMPPLLMITGYSFTLEQVSCPSTEALEKYKRVEVAYRTAN